MKIRKSFQYLEEVEIVEQSREPRFYPHEAGFPIRVGSNAEKTLQSIDGTLKRVEVILLELKNQFSVSDGRVLYQQKSEGSLIG